MSSISKKIAAIFCCSLLAFSLSLNANGKDSKNNVKILEKEIGNIKAEIIALKKEIQTIKNQKAPPQTNLLEKIESLQGNQIDSKKIESILIKYGNNLEGMSTLHYAIKMGDINAVSLLIANGADVNGALPIVAKYNQVEMAKLLLENGADVNFVIQPNNYSTSNWYPIAYAASFGSRDLVTLLIDNGAHLDRIHPIREDVQPNYGPLCIAAKAGNYEAVIALVEAGSNLNGALDEASNLKYSDNPQHLELVKFLVGSGAERKNRYIVSPCPVINGYLKSVDK